MIADRHVFVIRQQRIVRAKELARIGGVVDAGEEVGVIADRGRKLEPAILGAVKEPRAQGLDARSLAAIGGENLAYAAPQRAAGLAPERKQRVERRAGCSLDGLRRESVE